MESILQYCFDQVICSAEVYFNTPNNNSTEIKIIYSNIGEEFFSVWEEKNRPAVPIRICMGTSTVEYIYNAEVDSLLKQIYIYPNNSASGYNSTGKSYILRNNLSNVLNEDWEEYSGTIVFYGDQGDIEPTSYIEYNTYPYYVLSSSVNINVDINGSIDDSQKYIDGYPYYETYPRIKVYYSAEIDSYMQSVNWISEKSGTFFSDESILEICRYTGFNKRYIIKFDFYESTTKIGRFSQIYFIKTKSAQEVFGPIISTPYTHAVKISTTYNNDYTTYPASLSASSLKWTVNDIEGYLPISRYSNTALISGLDYNTSYTGTIFITLNKGTEYEDTDFYSFTIKTGQYKASNYYLKQVPGFPIQDRAYGIYFIDDEASEIGRKDVVCLAQFFSDSSYSDESRVCEYSFDESNVTRYVSGLRGGYNPLRKYYYKLNLYFKSFNEAPEYQVTGSFDITVRQYPSIQELAITTNLKKFCRFDFYFSALSLAEDNPETLDSFTYEITLLDKNYNEIGVPAFISNPGEPFVIVEFPNPDTVYNIKYSIYDNISPWGTVEYVRNNRNYQTYTTGSFNLIDASLEITSRDIRSIEINMATTEENPTDYSFKYSVIYGNYISSKVIARADNLNLNQNYTINNLPPDGTEITIACTITKKTDNEIMWFNNIVASTEYFGDWYSSYGTTATNITFYLKNTTPYINELKGGIWIDGAFYNELSVSNYEITKDGLTPETSYRIYSYVYFEDYPEIKIYQGGTLSITTPKLLTGITATTTTYNSIAFRATGVDVTAQELYGLIYDINKNLVWRSPVPINRTSSTVNFTTEGQNLQVYTQYYLGVQVLINGEIVGTYINNSPTYSGKISPTYIQDHVYPTEIGLRCIDIPPELIGWFVFEETRSGRTKFVTFKDGISDVCIIDELTPYTTYAIKITGYLNYDGITFSGLCSGPFTLNTGTNSYGRIKSVKTISSSEIEITVEGLLNNANNSEVYLKFYTIKEGTSSTRVLHYTTDIINDQTYTYIYSGLTYPNRIYNLIVEVIDADTNNVLDTFTTTGKTAEGVRNVFISNISSDSCYGQILNANAFNGHSFVWEIYEETTLIYTSTIQTITNGSSMNVRIPAEGYLKANTTYRAVAKFDNDQTLSQAFTTSTINTGALQVNSYNPRSITCFVSGMEADTYGTIQFNVYQNDNLIATKSISFVGEVTEEVEFDSTDNIGTGSYTVKATGIINYHNSTQIRNYSKSIRVYDFYSIYGSWFKYRELIVYISTFQEAGFYSGTLKLSDATTGEIHYNQPISFSVININYSITNLIRNLSHVNSDGTTVKRYKIEANLTSPSGTQIDVYNFIYVPSTPYWINLNAYEFEEDEITKGAFAYYVDGFDTNYNYKVVYHMSLTSGDTSTIQDLEINNTYYTNYNSYTPTRTLTTGPNKLLAGKTYKISAVIYQISSTGQESKVANIYITAVAPSQPFDIRDVAPISEHTHSLRILNCYKDAIYFFEIITTNAHTGVRVDYQKYQATIYPTQEVIVNNLQDNVNYTTTLNTYLENATTPIYTTSSTYLHHTPKQDFGIGYEYQYYANSRLLVQSIRLLPEGTSITIRLYDTRGNLIDSYSTTDINFKRNVIIPEGNTQLRAVVSLSCEGYYDTTYEQIVYTTDSSKLTDLDPWNWYISNHTATAEDTHQAYTAVDGHVNQPTTNFKYTVWNDMVYKAKEQRDAIGLGWTNKYLTYEQTLMTPSDKAMTAARYNSVIENLSFDFKSQWAYVESGVDRLLGERFILIARLINYNIGTETDLIPQDFILDDRY